MTYPVSPGIYSTEHEIFRETFRRFLQTEAEPYLEEWNEKHEVPREFYRKAGAAGVLGVDIPEEYGGPGGDFLHRLVIAEELGYSPAGASIGSSFIGDNISHILYHNANEEQRRKWLPKMVTGEVRFAFAITEPDSGSDVAGMRSTAVRDGDEFVINGAKTFIGNANTADVVIFACKTKPELGAKGISCIIVEMDRPGVSRGRKLRKMGMSAADTGEIAMENVRVPVSNLMGEEGRGMNIMLGGVNSDRIVWPLIAHAAATRAFHETVNFVKSRKAFGQTIFDFQNTQFKLAEIKTELAVGRAFLDDVIRDYKANGKLDMLKCAMCKMWVPEM